jgi:hypothetical protein
MDAGYYKKMSSFCVFFSTLFAYDSKAQTLSRIFLLFVLFHESILLLNHIRRDKQRNRAFFQSQQKEANIDYFLSQTS